MPKPDSLLKHTAFSVLTEENQNKVRDLFNVFETTDPQTNAPLQFDLSDIFHHRGSLATNLNVHLKQLTETNPALFNYLNPQQKQVLEEDLLFTFYLLSVQLHLNETEHRRQQHTLKIAQLMYCARLISELRDARKTQTPALIQQQASDRSEKYLKYLGLTAFGPFLAEKVSEFSSGKTTVIKNWMDDINNRRLYWVWGGGLLASIFGMIPESFAQKPQAEAIISSPDISLGYTSWILYYTRCGLSLGLLLKHTIAGPWMSQAERSIPALERFKTQWNQRKFGILNDSVWATVNLVTFFWLNGRGILGYWGNLLTTGLLLFDLSLNIWRLCEQNTEHNRQMAQYEEDIRTLRTRLTAARAQTQEALLLEEQLRALMQAKQAYELDWKQKQNKIILDVVYASALVIAFSVFSCCFIPPSLLLPTTTMLFGVAGSALCFILTVAYTAISGGMDLSKSKKERDLASATSEDLIQRFTACEDEAQKKLLYLEARRRLAKSNYHDQMMRFQTMGIVRGLLVDALMPPLVFASFMFLPFGVGFGVLAFGLVLAILSHRLISQSAPKASALGDFDETAYQEFAQNPRLKTLKAIESQQSRTAQKPQFFPATPAEDTEQHSKEKNGADQTPEAGDLSGMSSLFEG